MEEEDAAQQPAAYSEPAQAQPPQAQAPQAAYGQPAYSQAQGFPQQQGFPQGQPGLGYSQGYVPTRRTSGLAVAALVVGIFSIVLFCVPLLGPALGAVAIVLGAIAMSVTKNPAVGGRGMAITGLVLGIVGVLVLVFQVSVFLPSLNRARETANRVKCASNLRQIGQGCFMYANDNHQQFPPDLGTLVTAESMTPRTFVCPSGPANPASATSAAWVNKNSDYVYLGAGRTTTMGPSEVLVYENPVDHHEGMEILFGDGSVQWFKLTDAQSLIMKQTGHMP